MNESNLGPEDYSKNLSKIEFKNHSINSSLKSLSRGEDFIQKDILQVLNGQNNVNIYFLFIFFLKYRKKMEIIMIIIKSKNYLWKTHFIVEVVKILFLNLII
jgi:hypothetical protein